MGMDSRERWEEALRDWTGGDPVFQLENQESLRGKSGIVAVPRCGASSMGKWGLGLQAEGPALAGAWGRAEHPGERRRGRSSSGGPDDTSKLSFCPVLLSSFIQVIFLSSVSRRPQAGSRRDHTSCCRFHGHTPGLPSTSFTSSHAGSLGLPDSCLVRWGADVIQLAQKHRLEKTHTVNLTGN